MNERENSQLAPEGNATPGQRKPSEVDTAQVQARLLQLSTQLQEIQAQLAHLLNFAQSSGSQIDALTHHLTGLDITHKIDERLADLLERAEAYQGQLNEVTETARKLSRTQFKANTLAESKEQQITAALKTLQEIVARREASQEAQQWAQQEQLDQARGLARGDLAAELLPVLDGIEMALDSGRSLLQRRRQQRQTATQAPAAQPAENRSIQRAWQQFRRSLAGEPVDVDPRPQPPIYDEEMETGLNAWLDGLKLVRERFLALLNTEGIEVIPALRQPFDPKLHVAISAEPRTDVQPGVVIRVLRQGYRQRGRVLRFAEVIVAQRPAQD